MIAHATLVIDGDAVVFRFLAVQDEVNQHVHDPPFAQTFPAANGHDSIDAYFGAGATTDPWYPR